MQTVACLNHLINSHNTFPSESQNRSLTYLCIAYTHTRAHALTHTKSDGIFNLFFSLSLSLCLWITMAGIREKSEVAKRQVVVAMVNLSGTAGPISIKCGQAGAEPARLMPTQTDRTERLLRHAGWRGELSREEQSRLIGKKSDKTALKMEGQEKKCRRSKTQENDLMGKK